MLHFLTKGVTISFMDGEVEFSCRNKLYFGCMSFHRTPGFSWGVEIRKKVVILDNLPYSVGTKRSNGYSLLKFIFSLL